MRQICLDIIAQNHSLQDALNIIQSTLEHRRLSKEERGDLGELAILYTLLALQQKYGEYIQIFHSVLFRKQNSDWTTEVDFIVVTPYAVFVIEGKSFYGETVIQKNHKLKVKNQYGVREYDVVYQNQGHCRTLYQLIYPYLISANVIRPVVTLFSIGNLKDERDNKSRTDYPIVNVQFLFKYIDTILIRAINQKMNPTVNMPKCIQIINKNNIQSEESMLEHIKRIQSRYRK